MVFEVKFDEGASTEEKLETAVFQAIGAATVCWESVTDTGVFDSTRAKEIGDWLLEYIRGTYARERGSIY